LDHLGVLLHALTNGVITATNIHDMRKNYFYESEKEKAKSGKEPDQKMSAPQVKTERTKDSVNDAEKGAGVQFLAACPMQQQLKSSVVLIFSVLDQNIVCSKVDVLKPTVVPRDKAVPLISIPQGVWKKIRFFFDSSNYNKLAAVLFSKLADSVVCVFKRDSDQFSVVLKWTPIGKKCVGWGWVDENSFCTVDRSAAITLFTLDRQSEGGLIPTLLCVGGSVMCSNALFHQRATGSVRVYLVFERTMLQCLLLEKTGKRSRDAVAAYCLVPTASHHSNEIPIAELCTATHGAHPVLFVLYQSGAVLVLHDTYLEQIAHVPFERRDPLAPLSLCVKERPSPHICILEGDRTFVLK
jgi:hypothetical protein